MKDNGKRDDVFIVVDAKNTGEPAKPAEEKPKENCLEQKPDVPPQSRKKTILRTLFLVVICALSIAVMMVLPEQLNEDSSKTLGEIFRDMDSVYFFLAILVWGFMLLLDASKFFLIGKVAVGKASIKTSLKVAMVGKYYDNITPFSAGEPFQIVYLNKKGYTGGQSSAIVLIKFFVQMFSWLLVSAILMIFFKGALDGLDPTLATTLKVGAWIGFAFTSIPPITILLIIFLPKLANALISAAAFVGYKLKIIKDKQKLIGKANKIACDFTNCLSIMSRKPLYFALLIFICFFEPIVTLSFPYFLVVSFAHVIPSLGMVLKVMALNIFATYAVVIMPTPGNSGFIETTFTLAFSTIAANVLFGVTFTWRFFTYYFYILVGLGISIFEIIRNLVQAKKRAKDKT